MATLLGNLDRRGDEGWSGNQNRFANTEIDRVRNRRRSCDAPLDIDGVIIGCESAKHWAWRGRRRADVYVGEGSGCGVIKIFRVNVQKGRLNEAPDKGGSAQDCAGCSHDFLC